MDHMMRMNQMFAQKTIYESYSRNTAQEKRGWIREDTRNLNFNKHPRAILNVNEPLRNKRITCDIMPSVEVRNERSRCFEFWIIWKFCQNEFHGHTPCLHVSHFCTSSQKEESDNVFCKKKVFSKLRHMLMLNPPWLVDFLIDLKLVSFQFTTGSVWALCMRHVGWGKRRHRTHVKLSVFAPCRMLCHYYLWGRAGEAIPNDSWVNKLLEIQGSFSLVFFLFVFFFFKPQEFVHKHL